MNKIENILYPNVPWPILATWSYLDWSVQNGYSIVSNKRAMIVVSSSKFRCTCNDNYK